MKKVFSMFMAAFFALAMVACDPNDVFNPDDTTGGGNNHGSAETDTTIMNYTLMRSLVDIDWDEACARVMAMGFTEFTPEDAEENTRAFIKGNMMGDCYTCFLRCNTPESDNLVGAVVMQEHRMGTSNQATSLEHNIYFINDELRVLTDMQKVVDAGNIMYGDMMDDGQWDGPHETFYTNLDDFIAASQALEQHNTVTANWANNYLFNNMNYTTTCSAITNTQPYVKMTDNIISLVNDSRNNK